MTASSALEEYREACGRLQDTAGTALRSAINAGQARRDEQAAFEQLQDLQDAIVPLEAAAENGRPEQLQSAEDHLADIRSHDAAHTAGAGLSAGEPCLICQRPLPDDYQPPASADPAALQAADRSSEKSAEGRPGSCRRNSRMRAGRAANAQLEHEKRRSATQAAQDRLEQARQNAVAEMQHLTRRQWGDGIGSPGEQEFRAVLEAACSRLSAPDEDDQTNCSARRSASCSAQPARRNANWPPPPRRPAKPPGKPKPISRVNRRSCPRSRKPTSRQKPGSQTARKRHHDALAGSAATWHRSQALYAGCFPPSRWPSPPGTSSPRSKPSPNGRSA